MITLPKLTEEAVEDQLDLDALARVGVFSGLSMHPSKFNDATSKALSLAFRDIARTPMVRQNVPEALFAVFLQGIEHGYRTAETQLRKMQERREAVQ